MLTRMVLKLLFKATVPLIAMVGVTSYSLYLRGGDPAGMMSKVWDGAMAKIAGSARSATSGAGDALQALKPGDSDGSAPATTRVYTWKDENGTTQFGNVPPAGIAAETKIIHNNVNVVAATPARPAAAEPASTADGDTVMGEGERLPGVAGMLHGDGRNVDTSGAQAEALVQMLQAR